VLGYGSELNDYMIESGDSVSVTQSSDNKTYTSGESAGFNYFLLQTFTVPTNINISSIDLKITNSSAGTLQVAIYQYTGTPDPANDTRITSGSKYCIVSTNQVVNVALVEGYTLSTANTYYIEVYWGNAVGTCNIHATNTNPYANGSLYTTRYIFNVWGPQTNYASDDLYFVVYKYGGNTTSVYTSEDPSTILTEVIEDYNSRGGRITIPQGTDVSAIKQISNNTSLPSGAWGNCYSQTFTPTESIVLEYIQIQAAVTSGSTFVTCTLRSGSPSSDSIQVIGGLNYITNNGVYVANAIGISVTNTTLEYKQLEFSSVNLIAGQEYHLEFYFVNLGFGNLQFRSATLGDPYQLDTQVGKLYYANLVANNTSAGLAFNANYPAIYFKLFNTPLSYGSTSGYLATNSSVSYTFKVNTVLEGISKIVELAPSDWYWYINQGTNELQFSEKSQTPDHTFSFDKDIIDAEFEKRIEDITNVIYFTGGDMGAGVNFYKKYTIPESIIKYGIKSQKYTDGRVTLEATADTIANSILSTKSVPELRVTLQILDDNNDIDMGYDIESIKVGDVIAVRNITQQVGLSTWDTGRFDEAYWDFNIYNLSSLQMQIQKLEYKQDSVVISASTIPLDVNKRIEDINRNLEALQTANNPTTPS
jgi:hypothetical protein